MRWFMLALLLAFSAGAGAASRQEDRADKHFEAVLKRIDPADRLEQICDYAATVKIGHDKNPYRPDRAILGSLSPAQVAGDTIAGSGGAFRSKGRWYQFSFNCKVSPDRMKVLSFDYKIGDVIPDEKWEGYGLYP